MMGFVCSVCGRYHERRLLDIRMGLPDPVHRLDEEERTRRSWIADDFAVLDDAHFYLRGLLTIPIPELESRFGYGVWVELEPADWQRLAAHWHDAERWAFAPVSGLLANELAPYSGTAGLAITLEPVAPDRLPSVHLADADHPLVADQRHGITAARSDELAATVLHA